MYTHIRQHGGDHYEHRGASHTVIVRPGFYLPIVSTTATRPCKTAKKPGSPANVPSLRLLPLSKTGGSGMPLRMPCAVTAASG